MKKLLLIIFLFIGIVAKADNLLVIEMKDVSKVTFSLNDKPKISFSKEKLFIESDNVEADYNLEDVHIFYFTDTTTGTTEINEEVKKVNFSYFNEILNIDGIEEKDIVKIYDISGKVQQIDYSRNEDKITISLKELPKGIYIVNVAQKHSIKIIK